MFKNSVLSTALALTAAIAVWGIIDTEGLTEFAASAIKIQFNSRAWFIMLTVSFICS